MIGGIASPFESAQMPRTLSELLREIASQALTLDEPILAHLCRMAALEAAGKDWRLSWEWETAGSVAPKAVSSGLPTDAQGPTAKPYQVWSKRGTGTYSVMAPNAKA